MNWEEFIAQHDGLQIIKEKYGLTDELITKACVKSISELINLAEFSKRLDSLDIEE